MEQHDTPGMFMIVGTRRSVVTLMESRPRVSIPEWPSRGSEPDFVVSRLALDSVKLGGIDRRCRSQLERRAGVGVRLDCMYLGRRLPAPGLLTDWDVFRAGALANAVLLLLACGASPGRLSAVSRRLPRWLRDGDGCRASGIVINGTSAWLCTPGVTAT